MKESKVARYFLILLLVILLYLSLLTIFPVIKNIILALVFAFAFYPIYNLLKKYLKNGTFASIVMVFFILLIIIIPGSFIAGSLIKQSQSAYLFVNTYDFNQLLTNLPPSFTQKIQLNRYISEVVLNVKNFIVNSAPGFITSIAESLLGLFVMFFVMFYAFRDGKVWITKFEEHFPLKKEYTNKLLSDTEKIVKGVLYGYILTAVIQGSLAGFIFFILGIPNPVFWGFIMIILAAIPFLGTFIIWLPAALIQILMGEYLSGIILLVLGFVVIMNIDNFLRPKLISQKSDVHPAIILVGIIGGLYVFGFTGIILGPLILTLLMVIIKFVTLEFEY